MSRRTHADEAAAARRLAGTLIASIRRVTAVDPARRVAIEFETKCGRVVHLTARGAVDDGHLPSESPPALKLRDGPFAPTSRRTLEDLTGATRVAFTDRPRVITMHALTGDDATAWCLTFDTGFALVWADLAGAPLVRSP